MKDYLGKNANDESKTTFRRRKYEAKSRNVHHDISDSHLDPYLVGTIDPNRTFLNRKNPVESGPNSERRLIPAVRKNRFQVNLERSEDGVHQQENSVQDIVGKYGHSNPDKKTEEDEDV